MVFEILPQLFLFFFFFAQSQSIYSIPTSTSSTSVLITEKIDASLTNSEMEILFLKWMEKYDKVQDEKRLSPKSDNNNPFYISYSIGSQEYWHRFSVYKENFFYALEHNNQYKPKEDGYTYFQDTDNVFMDLTDEEFQSIYLSKFNISGDTRAFSSVMKVNEPTDFFSNQDTKRLSDLPSEWNWAKSDMNPPVVTPVSNQGTVGSCWAFSTVGAVESAWALAGNSLIQLSPEYLVDCDGSADYPNKHADCSVFGGWPYLAYDFIIKKGGLPSEEAYPYCSGKGECYPCMLGPVDLCGPPPLSCNRTIEQEQCPSMKPVASISSWEYISQNENEIQSILYSKGPLSVLLDATGLQRYKGGIYSSKICSSKDLDHAVVLVGYGTDSDSGLDYWIVKNSWGTRWGEDGYFRIVRGKEECGINKQVTRAII